jgi:DNA invertase Pin-like site-specific DNA recombinase
VYDCYARLSWKPDTGDLEKIEDQWEDCRGQVERLGGVLGKRLDDGASAWKKGAKRPGWDELLARLRSGVSDGVMVWNTDRLLRAGRDLEALIDLGDKGYRVASATGEYDLSDSDHRFILRIKVAQAEKESDDKSRRIKRRFQGKRERGVPHPTARRFGFPGRDLTWAPGEGQTGEDRPEVSAAVVRRERAALRAGTRDVVAGVSWCAVAGSWNEAGLRTAHGREWVAVTVRSVLGRGINAGLIEHDGVVCARLPGKPIVDPESFGLLRALLVGRRRGRVAGDRSLGSGIVRCGLCDTPLSINGGGASVTYADGALRRQYRCNPQRRGCGKLSADMRGVDRELETFVVDTMCDRGYAESIALARSRVRERLVAVREQIAKIEGLQTALSVRLGALEIEVDAFDAGNRPLVASLKKLKTERDELTGGVPDGPARAMTRREAQAQWDAADIVEKRAMARTALGRRTMVVDPVGRHGRGFDRTRVRIKQPATPAAPTVLVAR